MPALAVRDDIGSEELRRRARRERDGRVSARLIAIANALEGMDRASAARLAGMYRQTLRDWVPHAGRPQFWPLGTVALGNGQRRSGVDRVGQTLPQGNRAINETELRIGQPSTPAPHGRRRTFSPAKHRQTEHPIE